MGKKIKTKNNAEAGKSTYPIIWSFPQGSDTLCTEIYLILYCYPRQAAATVEPTTMFPLLFSALSQIFWSLLRWNILRLPPTFCDTQLKCSWVERAQDNSIIQQDKRETSVPVQNGLLFNDTSEAFYRNIVVKIKLSCLFKAKMFKDFWVHWQKFTLDMQKHLVRILLSYGSWGCCLPIKSSILVFFHLNYRYQFWTLTFLKQPRHGFKLFWLTRKT